jgi:hypothetical protein
MHSTMISFCCSCLLSWMVIEPQTTAPATQPAPQAAPTESAGDLRDDVSMRPPLLREGSLLVEAAGVLRRDPSSNWWVLAVAPDDPGFDTLLSGPSLREYKLIMLPTTTLREMQRVLESMPEQDATFEVTGQVLVYRGRNYLLTTHAGRLTRADAGDAVPADAPASATTSPASAPATRPATAPAATQADSAEDIMHSLERSIESAPRHIGAEPASEAQVPAMDTSRVGVSGAAGFNAEALATSATATDKALREGTAIQSRRGKITRDAAGAWLFVFDADATGDDTADASGGGGGSDPPMRLLPCLLLEKIEDYARRAPPTAPVLISGEVFLYNGRNYLLPTVYRLPQERTKLSP